MEEVSHRPSVEYVPPPLPAKARQTGLTTLTQISGHGGPNEFGGGADASHGSSMHSLVLNTTPPSTTVLVAAPRAPRDTAAAGAHVVTIRVNADADRHKTPKISSVHLKSDANLDTLKLENDIYKKNNSLVRITIDETHTDVEHGDRGVERAPYINCNSYPLLSMSTVMSSGQCSPSDTLDSGTCSDLDGTPPPLPKKKITKTNARKKAVTVTMIGAADTCSHNELDFEDNDSNISCDSLNSSDLNGSVHNDESHDDVKKNKKCSNAAEESASFNKKDAFLPRGLLRDIRDRTTKLNNIDVENKIITVQLDVNDLKTNDDVKGDENRIKLKNGNESKIEMKPTIINITKTPIVIETTYEDRKIEEQSKTNKQCYSGEYFDTDKFYDFHLNEKQFDVKDVKSGSVKGVDESDSVECFAGVKDFKGEDTLSTIKSSKGTIRGVKNRVRAGIATFLQINDTVKSYREKDAGKVVIYSTTMGIVRSTYQRCMLVKKILRNLLVKYEERDVFMSTEYQDEIRDRLKSDKILVPQLFVDGQHIGDAETVEKLNESGELRKMLKPYKSPDACTTCQMCGGFRLLPCRVCNGSKKSLHRNHFTAEFVALKCMNCDEVGLVRCEACS